MSSTRPEASVALDTETLFRRHAAFVASFLHRLGVPAADLEDVVQEVFMTAHRKGGYAPGAASPTTYLARLALEARLSNRRRNHRFQTSRGEALASVTVSGVASTPEQDLTLQRAAASLQRVLDTMDPGMRSVFVLFELEGEPCETIAAGLGIAVGTVYSRLHAARKAFHEHARSQP